jgi:hypothetical protein
MMPKSTATIIAGPGVGEQIARMHVGVEIAVADRVPEERLQQVSRQRPAVEPRRVERREVAHRNARRPSSVVSTVSAVWSQLTLGMTKPRRP